MQQDRSDVWEASCQIAARLEHDFPNIVELWLAGIRDASRPIENIHGLPIANAERDRVLLGLIGHAINTQLVAYREATAGFYAQAMVLARIAEEDWAAWWYVRNRPNEAVRFGSGSAPPWNEMIQALEGIHGDRVGIVARNRMKLLHKLAHVEQTSVEFSWEVVGDAELSLGIGPYYNEQRFTACAVAFLPMLAPLIEVTTTMGLLAGGASGDVHAAAAFEDRVFAWLRSIGINPLA